VATELAERHSTRLRGIGVRFLAVALVVGAGLLVSSLVGGRMAKGKPFA
jgi:hypothetical protein